MSEATGSLWRSLASPFPGLRSFEEHEAPIFRGRDRQIDGIAELLASCRLVVVTGASGCGKSSLVRAGVLPALNGGGIAAAGDVWIEVYFRPGKDPLGNLASALAGKLLPPRPEDATSDWSSSEVEERTLDEVRALLDQANGLVAFRDRFESRLQLDPQLDQALRQARDPTAQLTEAGRLAERQADRLQPNANLVVIADQFEEIFNEFNQRSVAAEMLVARLLGVFQSPVLSASSMPTSRVYVIVTMRSEYLGLCATYRQMPYVLNHAAFYVSRLDRAELKAAATEPLRRWHRYAEQAPAIKLEFDPHLLDQLLDAAVLIKDDPDHLPLFQHALARLWWIAQDEQSTAGPREGTIGMAHLLRAVSLHHEDELGRLEVTRLLARVLEEHAEELYRTLDPEQRRIVEVMLRRLATKEPTGNVVRRLVPVRDIAACADCPESGVEVLLDRFGESRHELVQTRDARGGGEERLVDLAHEALIRKWPSFRRWVDDEAQLSRDFSALIRRAQRWAETGAGERNILRDDDLLWARTWLRSMRLYRRSPGAMTAWARRYPTTPPENGRIVSGVRLRRSASFTARALRLDVRADTRRTGSFRQALGWRPRSSRRGPRPTRRRPRGDAPPPRRQPPRPSATPSAGVLGSWARPLSW